jgi:ADP-ribose pyrophosphatase YjhB (NUDIX family)
VNIGETVEKTCRREVREEPGVNIDESNFNLSASIRTRSATRGSAASRIRCAGR